MTRRPAPAVSALVPALPRAARRAQRLKAAVDYPLAALMLAVLAPVILLAMLASKGTSVLRSTYVIHRGYEDLAERLNELGANIEPFRDI